MGERRVCGRAQWLEREIAERWVPVTAKVTSCRKSWMRWWPEYRGSEWVVGFRYEFAGRRYAGSTLVPQAKRVGDEIVLRCDPRRPGRNTGNGLAERQGGWVRWWRVAVLASGMVAGWWLRR